MKHMARGRITGKHAGNEGCSNTMASPCGVRGGMAAEGLRWVEMRGDVLSSL